jgi:hypothetical protein
MADRPVRSQYEDFMRHVYTPGSPKTDRTGTGTGTRSVFGYPMRFDPTRACAGDHRNGGARAASQTAIGAVRWAWCR